MRVLRRTESRRGASGSRRSSYGHSILHYLVALALVPSIGIPILAGFFIDDRLEEAIAARRIGKAMMMLGELDSARKAISGELAASAVANIAPRYGLTLKQVEEILGEGRVVPIHVARSRSDEALASVHPDSETRPDIEALRADLRKVRLTADESFERTTAAAGFGWETYERFAALLDKLTGTQNDTIQRVVTGYYGAGSSRLLTTVSQLQRVAATVDAGKRQASYLQGLFAATTPEDRVAVLSGLGEATVTWRVLSADLPSHLSDDIVASWNRVTGSPEVEAFQQFLTSLVVEPRPNTRPSTSMPGVREAARTAVELTDGLTTIVGESVAEGVSVARADQTTAEQRVGVAVSASLLLLLVTGAFVLLVGGTIRRRLRELAAAAERFSAGQLEPMAVHGPQEIALVSTALNDAVHSLQRVAMQAERLSAGDLNAAELAEPAPGPLGRAVHTSVQRIVATVREGEKLRVALAHQAAHDPLTNLPNRAETEDLLRRALARAHRTDARIGVLFVDLDQFKRCNDELGHAAGDHVLRTAAARMIDVVRPGDSVCRLGGDEFIVIVEPVGTDQGVVDIANRIVTALAEPMTYDDVSFVVTGTIGVTISDRTSDVDTLLREADSAMYRGKATARGSVAAFDEHLRGDF